MRSCVPDFEVKSLEVEGGEGEFCHLAFGLTESCAHVINLHGAG